MVHNSKNQTFKTIWKKKSHVKHIEHHMFKKSVTQVTQLFNLTQVKLSQHN